MSQWHRRWPEDDILLALVTMRDMMPQVLAPTLLVVVCGFVAAVLAPWLLRHAQEPELEPDETKTPYAELSTWQFSAACGLWAAALATAATVSVELSRIGPWLVVAIVGALTSVVDIATTWIPRRWLHSGWLLTGLALVVSAGLVNDWPGIGRAAIGVAIIGGAYGLVYTFSILTNRGFLGFADVRLGILTGMIAGWRSVPTATSALVVGSVIGALWGVVNLIRNHREPYAYGPGIVLGPYLVVLLSAITLH